MSLYLDASVLLPTMIEEAGSAVVDKFIRSKDAPIWVSEFAAAEVASAISRLVRIGLLEGDDARARLSDFDAWRATDSSLIDVEGADIRLAGVIVRRFDLMLRAPDALHVAICRRLAGSLVTMDRRLARAATDLGVTVTLL